MSTKESREILNGLLSVVVLPVMAVCYFLFYWIGSIVASCRNGYHFGKDE